MNKKAIQEYLSEFDLMSYRLSDGSHIIANEDHYDNDAKSFYVTRPIEIKIGSRGDCFFIPWLIAHEDDLISISNANIMAFAQPSANMQIQYHRFILKTNLDGILTEKEIKIVLDQLFYPEVDNQEDVDDIGYMDDMDNSVGYSSSSKSLEWRMKQYPYNN